MKFRSFLLPFVGGVIVAVSLPALAQTVSSEFGFPDVSPGQFFERSVDRLARRGIVKGYDDGRFGPQDIVTRGQVTVMIDRYDREIIGLLRDQIEEMRGKLNLGQCGDGTQQTGEECDDGNDRNNDGCTEECIDEAVCRGGYMLGEEFRSPDGCNTCTCTENGIACTERACSQKCFSSAECAGDEVCSVELGDCRYPCPRGAVCIQACAGVCVPRPTSQTCGNGVCDRGEADEYSVGGDPVVRGSCPKDCEGGLSACERRKQSIDDFFEAERTCEVDQDCAVFMRACSPYQTCGKPVRAGALSSAEERIQAYIEECGDDGKPSICASCVGSDAICLNGVCALRGE